MRKLYLPGGKVVEHQPINYAAFDMSGQGKNIESLLTPLEKSIWDAVLPLQDKRDDVGHAEVVTYFALKLNDYLSGTREISVPAAILHDTGWSQIGAEEMKALFTTDEMILSVAPNAVKGSPEWIDISRKLATENEKSIRLKHQIYGTNVAKEVLGTLGHNQNYINEIVEIISQHDTRKGFYSREDGIVRDADKLWRHTVFELKRNMIKRNEPPSFFYSWAHDKLDPVKRPGYLNFEVSRQVALIETSGAYGFYTANNR